MCFQKNIIWLIKAKREVLASRLSFTSMAFDPAATSVATIDRRSLPRCRESVNESFTLHIAYIDHFTAFHQAKNNFITGVDFINQPFSTACCPYQCSRCHLFNIQRRTHTLHKIFKQLMRFVQLFAEFLPPFFGIFTQQRQRALILPGSVQFDINIFAFRKRLKLGICATTPMEPTIANGAETILSATQAIM